MKNVIVLLFFISINMHAQFGSENIVSDEESGPISVVLVDLNNDSFLDILISARFGNMVVWYANLDGQGSYSEAKIIDSSLPDPEDTISFDVDGDGDEDVISLSGSNDWIVWYENLDGEGTFSNRMTISNTAQQPFSLGSADLDLDGDIDLVAGYIGNDSVVWFENLNGLGSFDAEQLISNNFVNGRKVALVDIDNDGDIDLVATATGAFGSILSWFANNGAGDFGIANIINDEFGSNSDVVAVDLDGDGDLDLITADPADDEIAWYKNLNGLGNFGIKNIISANSGFAIGLYASDFDNDNDIDIVCTAAQDGTLEYFENLDGNGSFGPKIIISDTNEGSYDVFGGDIDGDGDQDVVAVARNNNKVAWYENETILNIEETTLNKNVNVFPIPTINILKIVSNDIDFSSITVTDLNGAIIFTTTKNLESIDVSSYSSGVYFLTLEAANGATEVKKFVKE
jgi:hypothetical protein